MIARGAKTSDLDAPFTRRFTLQETPGEATEEGQVVWGVIFADAGVLFVEGDLQAPMQRVFDVPVGTDGLSDTSPILRREAAEVGAPLGLRLAVEGPVGLDHPEAGQVGPGGLVLEPVEVVREPRPTDLESAMSFVDGLSGRVCRRPVVQEEADLLAGGGVVGVESPDVVGPRRGEVCRDLLLRPHGVDRHQTPGDIEQVQELRNRGDLVGVLGRFQLAEDHVVLTGPGADQRPRVLAGRPVEGAPQRRNLSITLRHAGQSFTGHHRFHLP